MIRVAALLAFTLATLPAAAQELDLKPQQQVVFQDGKMFVVDIYDRDTVKLDNIGTAKIQVLQYRAVPNTHSCGQLGARVVRISGSGRVELGAKPFAEFLAAANYQSKYRESWENIRARKYKIISYQFGEKNEESLLLEGNRDDLTLTLKNNVGTVFSTRDLRSMGSFVDALNAAQKFIDTHKFEECL